LIIAYNSVIPHLGRGERSSMFINKLEEIASVHPDYISSTLIFLLLILWFTIPFKGAWEKTPRALWYIRPTSGFLIIALFVLSLLLKHSQNSTAFLSSCLCIIYFLIESIRNLIGLRKSRGILSMFRAGEVMRNKELKAFRQSRKNEKNLS
jgi:hypothetical protein